MKVHFAAAVDGDKSDFKKICQFIHKLDHSLVTDHYLSRTLDDIDKESPQEAKFYVERSMNWIKTADVVVFETTKPDISIGYELAVAVSLHKPVIALYNDKKSNPPNSIKGVEKEKLQIVGYNEDTIDDVLDIILENAAESADVRFNFFISPAIGNYLDWIAKNKKIPRSVYLRNLIQKDMEDNEEYR
ncbi:MAG: hypothetical protein GW762_03130 [Candidatus Pacebacteria bacterium]|nr:hypothetical protein [Candidatus Paceibacterota bacterium]PIR64247.1 MAG: hypothetical protein COU64_00205 [Candidatus Pacebacteria bacterium CG10_big_fil_rev_8_21_14_0_10_40_26]PIZ79066.1 MAG: hypothetical protein COY01_01405 [Candidatus Pacebacteria bacterium CG_4_10_14_0_2_um_filter_40_20]PJA69246.1 MAG: hypothetical protein CO156_01430 [Candidatus Pacebacteria bacterium CG_4_9_14_3_um_filter_40_12]PJC42032.1 MAG: hypothetical protein CO041_00115 [Candidatus Pacebacteria bacterium CG_4_9_